MSSKSTTTKFTLDPANPPVLTPEQARRLDESPIDYSDIPELPPGFWAKHRPVLVEQKAQITLRIDQDVLDFFRAQGARYQTRINAVLRSFVEAHAVPRPRPPRAPAVARHHK